MEISDRQSRILTILRQKRAASYDCLSKELNFSRSTVRRDLLQLEQMGLVTRGKGVVSMTMAHNKVIHYRLRALEHVEEKEAMARLAEDFLADGMTLFLDASTTAFRLCPLIVGKKDVTVVTNSLEAAHYLGDYPQVEVFVAGGYLREYSGAIVGEQAVEYLNQFRADLAVISCFGADADGLYEPSLQQACMKQQMLRNARQTVLLCDSSKFGRQFKFRVCPWEEISVLITDQRPSPELAEVIQGAGCEILA